MTSHVDSSSSFLSFIVISQPRKSYIFIVIVTGLLLWARRSFPWMAVGGILMFLAGGIPVLARHRLENLGEAFIVAGVIFAIRFFATKNGQGLRARPQGV